MTKYSPQSMLPGVDVPQRSPILLPPIGAIVTLLPQGKEAMESGGGIYTVKVGEQFIPELGFSIPVNREVMVGETGRVTEHRTVQQGDLTPYLQVIWEWDKGGISGLDEGDFYSGRAVGKRKWYQFTW